MAAIGNGDSPPHLIETPTNDANPVFYLATIANENLLEYVYVHAGNINALLSPRGGPPLYYAVRDNNVERVRFLLRKGADVNLGDHAGNSPLLVNCRRNDFCTRKSNEIIFHLLLESGADVNARNSDGCTALHVAKCHSKVKELLERGADANARDNKGRTPLDMNSGGILFHGGKGNPIVTELLHWGAEIVQGKVLFLLVQDKACSMETIRRVFQGTGHTDARDYEKCLCTPLHHAVRTGRAELVRQLLECGASVRARNRNGHTPLHTAVAFDCGVEVVSELIRKGADVIASTYLGDTPLHLAFRSVNESVVDLLLSQGADPDVLKSVPSSHPCSPLVVKHSVLRNYASRREYVESPPWRENSLTCTQCMSEIEDMRGTRLSKDLTLYDVAFGDKWDISCARKVYEFMSSGRFPMYSRLALPKLALNVRKHLLDRANDNSLFLRGLSRKSSFRINQHVLFEIVKYLSDNDCLNLYIAGCQTT